MRTISLLQNRQFWTAGPTSSLKKHALSLVEGRGQRRFLLDSALDKLGERAEGLHVITDDFDNGQ
jgi:hypothetical protein